MNEVCTKSRWQRISMELPFAFKSCRRFVTVESTNKMPDHSFRGIPLTRVIGSSVVFVAVSKRWGRSISGIRDCCFQGKNGGAHFEDVDLAANSQSESQNVQLSLSNLNSAHRVSSKHIVGGTFGSQLVLVFGSAVGVQKDHQKCTSLVTCKGTLEPLKMGRRKPLALKSQAAKKPTSRCFKGHLDGSGAWSHWVKGEDLPPLTPCLAKGGSENGQKAGGWIHPGKAWEPGEHSFEDGQYRSILK